MGNRDLADLNAVKPVSENRTLRVGILGGTFNPIHLGHLRSAEEIREAFALDRIYFVPAAQPPHKSSHGLVSAVHRFKMVELAIADNPYFFPSASELERSGPSYSIDTIRRFRMDLPSSSLFFILGFDAFREIHTWKEYPLIPALCNMIVTSRPGVSVPPIDQILPVALQTMLWYDPATKMYCHASGCCLAFYEIQGLSISASQVRQLALQGKSLRYLVPAAVHTYISEHDLYKQEESEH
ncbi:MAG: nicotinate-nucleotide adenylyltransferase [Deltaproteobacteria bacterium]|nr:nicotinate-nucleotide adenylyltransferase [Deltaproteobacteria bacterium]